MWKNERAAILIGIPTGLVACLAVLADVFRQWDEPLELWFARQELVATERLPLPPVFLWIIAFATLVAWFILRATTPTGRWTSFLFLLLLQPLTTIGGICSGYYLSPFGPTIAILFSALWSWILLQSDSARHFRLYGSWLSHRLSQSAAERVLQQWEGDTKTTLATFALIQLPQAGTTETRHAILQKAMASGAFLLESSPTELSLAFGLPPGAVPPEKSAASAACAAAHDIAVRWKKENRIHMALVTGFSRFGLVTENETTPRFTVSGDWESRARHLLAAANESNVSLAADIPTMDAAKGSHAFRPIGFVSLDGWGSEEIMELLGPNAGLKEHDRDNLHDYWRAVVETRRGNHQAAAPIWDRLRQLHPDDPLLPKSEETAKAPDQSVPIAPT